MKNSYRFHHKSKRTFDNLKICRCDEIGRRARLKILCGQPRAGSTPAIGIFFSYLEKDIMESNRRPVLTSQKMILNHFSRQSGHRHIFFIFRKDIWESNRIPVLTSQKMILNHFSRQSGHRHIFSYLEKILWSRTEKLYNFIFIYKKHLLKRFLYIN